MWTQKLILSEPPKYLNIKGKDKQIQVNNHKIKKKKKKKKKKEMTRAQLFKANDVVS